VRQARLKAPPNHPVSYYHCVSRVVNREFVFGDEEKEVFVKLMRRWEKFCQVRIITFCVMSNHFHLLVEVASRPAKLPDDAELLRQLGGIYSAGMVRELRDRMALMEAGGSVADLAELRESFLGRMWDISAFMKALKQQFTQWFNRKQARKGTLWEERFKSVLVEGAGEALATMAAYIDLNPMRAGLVADPKEFRWCGYAAAVAGDRRARQGFTTVVAALNRPSGTAAQVLAEYRVRLFGAGEQTGIDDPERGVRVRRGFDRATVERILGQKGKLSQAEMLRCRVRYFSDGAALGTREFVNAVFAHQRHRFGPKRKTGARPLRGVDAAGLTTLRDLRLKPLG